MRTSTYLGVYLVPEVPEVRTRRGFVTIPRHAPHVRLTGPLGGHARISDAETLRLLADVLDQAADWLEEQEAETLETGDV